MGILVGSMRSDLRRSMTTEFKKGDLVMYKRSSSTLRELRGICVLLDRTDGVFYLGTGDPAWNFYSQSSVCRSWEYEIFLEKINDD